MINVHAIKFDITNIRRLKERDASESFFLTRNFFDTEWQEGNYLKNRKQRGSFCALEDLYSYRNLVRVSLKVAPDTLDVREAERRDARGGKAREVNWESATRGKLYV